MQNKNQTQLLCSAGILAPIWLFVGVVIASSLYPDYSHLHQVLSELGAKDSPTANISPRINNYPLAILFIAFGIGVISTYSNSTAAKVSGYCIIVHGIGSFMAGFFACDFECPADSMATDQIIHGIAGATMFISLTIANTIWIGIAKHQLTHRWFGLFSSACLILSLIFLVFMIQALQGDTWGGLFQRLNYGMSVLWMGVFALLTWQQAKPAPQSTTDHS